MTAFHCPYLVPASWAVKTIPAFPNHLWALKLGRHGHWGTSAHGRLPQYNGVNLAEERATRPCQRWKTALPPQHSYRTWSGLCSSNAKHWIAYFRVLWAPQVSWAVFSLPSCFVRLFLAIHDRDFLYDSFIQSFFQKVLSCPKQKWETRRKKTN